ncbi:MAG: metallophosphoesterase [Magnetococcales bacterium]|nr:metallophosphoesterase [Magnetococcales bacterium]
MNKIKLALWLFFLSMFGYSTATYSQNALLDPLLTKPSLVFYSLGDQGSASKAQQAVAKAMELEAERSGKPDFILLLGDNFYPDGVFSVDDPQWNEKFEDIYRGPLLRKTPFFAVLGNHDHRTNSQAQVEYSEQGRGSKRWQMPGRVFSVDLGQIDKEPLLRLVGLDTTAKASFTKQASFIRQRFNSKNIKKPFWRLAAGHHPLFSVGPHGPTKSMHSQILPAMHESKIDLYLAGHDHNLQLISMPDAPYQVVSGGGGKSLYDIKSHDIEVEFASVTYGFVKVALSMHDMEITFFNYLGQILHKKIIKQ